MANLTKTLTTNKAFTRSYGIAGATFTSQRGQGIMHMISFLKENQSMMKAHKRYLRKNSTGVTYARFYQLVSAFKDIIHTKHGKELIKILGTRPEITYQSVVKNAFAYAEFMDTLSMVA